MNHNDVFGWCDFTDIYDEVVAENDSGLLVEIGSFLGRSAIYMGEKIKESGKNLKLICVDLFPTPLELERWKQSGAGQGEEFRILSELKDSHINTFCENVYQCGVNDYIVPIKSDSHKASSLFPDNYLSFIFVDAGHSRDIVLKDLELWWPKLISGKVMAGHDFFNGTNGVERAVYDFFNPLSIPVTRRGSSWWVRKP